MITLYGIACTIVGLACIARAYELYAPRFRLNREPTLPHDPNAVELDVHIDTTVANVDTVTAELDDFLLRMRDEGLVSNVTVDSTAPEGDDLVPYSDAP